jgi:hypothetical protein
VCGGESGFSSLENQSFQRQEILAYGNRRNRDIMIRDFSTELMAVVGDRCQKAHRHITNSEGRELELQRFASRVARS